MMMDGLTRLHTHPGSAQDTAVEPTAPQHACLMDSLTTKAAALTRSLSSSQVTVSIIRALGSSIPAAVNSSSIQASSVGYTSQFI